MRMRTRWAIHAVLIATATAASAAWSLDLQRELEFQIPSQMLGSALLQFSKQAGVQVLTGGIEVSKASSPGLSGHYTLASGLKQLLVDTGFVYRIEGENTISVVREDLQGQRQTGSSGLLLAQANGASPMDEPESAGGSSQYSKLEEIVVSATKREERLQDIPLSVSVLDEQTLVKQGATNLIDYATKIPNLAFGATGFTPFGLYGFQIRGVGGTGTTMCRSPKA